jgi:hypothetical protein
MAFDARAAHAFIHIDIAVETKTTVPAVAYVRIDWNIEVAEGA